MDYDLERGRDMKVLKNKDILKKKPYLKLMPNHYDYVSVGKRNGNEIYIIHKYNGRVATT